MFPFKETPSGNLKVSAKQVAFQTDNISVLVADPRTTSVNIETVDNMPRDGDYCRDSAMDTIMNQVCSMNSIKIELDLNSSNFRVWVLV